MNFNFFTKKSISEIVVESPVPDFIPYACHYDGETLLTKNGELLQIIKITGFVVESVGGEQIDLRNILRDSIIDNIDSASYALWFHTIRRKKNLSINAQYPIGFAHSLNNEWNNRNKWQDKYINEIYITIITEGVSENIKDTKSLIKALFFKKIKEKHSKNLQEKYELLNQVVNKTLRALQEFGAKKLKMFEYKGIFYSESLQFISKIMNLAEIPVKIPISDLSTYLANHKVAFGFSSFEIKGRTGKHFGAILGLKEYYEFSVQTLDEFLQLPMQFVISQAIQFVPTKKATKDFKDKNYILSSSGDQELIEAMDFNLKLSDNNKPTDFCQHQVTFMFLEDNLELLEKNIASAHDVFNNLGMVVTRKDLWLEQSFWAQLPANFFFLSHNSYLPSALMAGYCSLYNFPSGRQNNNHWGNPVTIFHTANGTPYFFNFHVNNNGHSAIIGPYGSGKTALLNFLVSQSLQFKPKLFFFDQLRASKVFIKSVNGNYTIIKPGVVDKDYAFNPLLLEDNPINRKFLIWWFGLLASAPNANDSQSEKIHFTRLVELIYKLPKEQRLMRNIAKYFGKIEPNSLAERMAKWHGQGEYAHLFDNQLEKDHDFTDDIYGFGMSFLLENKICVSPVFAYLLHKVELLLDGRKTIIVIDEAWNLVDNDIFAPMLEDLLNRFRKKNAMIIFASANIDNTVESKITNLVTEILATRIFLPNRKAEDSSNAYKETWGLTDDEFKMLSSMKVEKRQFMLKQEDTAIITKLNLSGMKELDVLSGSDKTVTIMDEVVKIVGSTPEKWLPKFYEKIAESKKIEY